MFFFTGLTGSWCSSLLSLSAGLILLFYLVFYIFLAGLFALTMYVMLQTLDDHKPTWQDRLATPGAAANDTNHTPTQVTVSCCRVVNSLLSLCPSQAWWLDPKQVSTLRSSTTSRTLRAGTCTLRPWTSSWHVSLPLGFTRIDSKSLLLWIIQTRRVKSLHRRRNHSFES